MFIKKVGVVFLLSFFILLLGCKPESIDATGSTHFSEEQIETPAKDDGALSGQASKLRLVQNQRITCSDTEIGANYSLAGNVTLQLRSGNRVVQTVVKGDRCWTDGKRLQEYVCKDGVYKGDHTFDCSRLGQSYICEQGACIVPAKLVHIMDMPLPPNSKCFSSLNSHLVECRNYVTEVCNYGDCSFNLACPKYFNPVYDQKGTFYPSACWAEQLGVADYSYGYSPQLQQFFRDLWAMKRNNHYVNVSSPNIEFSYIRGPMFRSTLWFNNTHFDLLNFIVSNGERENEVTGFPIQPVYPVFGHTSNALLIFVKVENAYPDEVLLQWNEQYELLLNDYLQHKQQVPNPLQYNITPVVINLPAGVRAINAGSDFYTEEEMRLLTQAGLEQAEGLSPDTIIVAPIAYFNSGGYYWGNFEGREFIMAALSTERPYSEQNIGDAIQALYGFQEMYTTISHEVLHAVGLAGDHAPMGYGTQFLAEVGQNVDPRTGDLREAPLSICDFYGVSPEAYAIEMPPEMQIVVGNEPATIFEMPIRIDESPTGRCLFGPQGDLVLKDRDLDGIYEIMHEYNLIGMELQRTLGWSDVDGDGVTELVDPQPYGGLHAFPFDIRGRLGEDGSNDKMSFEVIDSTVQIDGCNFAQIQISSGRVGLLPLQCPEFNDIATNVYRDVKYYWFDVESRYGIVLIPTLSR